MVRKCISFFIVIGILCTLISCAMNQSASMYKNKQTKQDLQGNDRVLKNLCKGMEAFHNNRNELAKQFFTNATLDIASIWDDTPQARKARSMWYEERYKPFKGEPYERMMSFYYLGLLYLKEKDFGNAQACFRQSVMQDAFAEEEQYRADVALSLFLQGWALQAQGSDGQANNAYKLVKELRPDFQLPNSNIQPNVLLIVETGKSPRKIADGIGAYVLRFFRGKNFIDKKAKYSIDGSKYHPMLPIEDIYWQAKTRGSRAVDKIVEGKVNFQESSSDLGSGFVEMSKQYLYNPAYKGTEMQSVGYAMGAIGVVALLLSANAKPAADVRYWDNLPDLVHLEMLNLEPGNHSIEIKFQDENNNFVNIPSKRIQVAVPTQQNGPILLWISAHDRETSRYSM